MRKFFFSMKTLALTLALVVGGSAWAQITSLPFVADYSDTESPAPFGEPAFVTGNDAIGKVVAVNNGSAEATFAVDGGAYALGNAEEVTVSFTMYNGWVGGGGNNTFAVLNSADVPLASITYHNTACNITDVTLAGKTVEGFEAFTGQSGNGSKGVDSYTASGKSYLKNTDEAKYNGVVTIKINSFGGVSLSFVGGSGNVDKTFSATVAEGTKLDLAKLTISCASNNVDRATGYGDLTVTSRSMIKYANDYSNGEITWKTSVPTRFDPVILEEDGNKYLSVNQDNRANNGCILSSTETADKVAAGEDFTISFRVKLGASNDQEATAFNIYDAANSAKILSLAEVVKNATAWTINDGKQTATVSAGCKNLDDLSWINIKVTSIAGGKTYLTITDAEGEVIDEFNQTLIPTLSETGGLGKLEFVTSRNYANFAIDDIVVRDVVESADIPETPVYTYTVKYETEDGEQVKDPVEREEYEGVELAILDEDKETVVVGKSQYTYISDDAEGQTAAADGSTVITVLFEKTTVSDYVVKYVTADGTELQEVTTHKNVLVGTEVTASAGEQSKILVDGVIYNYASGNESITVAEDETQNVITLVFAPIEDVTGYYLATYETGSTNWTAGTGGRYTPIIVNGSSIADRVVEDGEPVAFANKTRFTTVDQSAGSRNNNGGPVNLASLGIDQIDYTFEAKLLLGSSNDQAGTNFLVKNLAGDANILAIQQINEKGTTTWTVNGETTVVLPNSGTYTGETNNNLNNYSWYDFKVTVYKGYTFVTITDEEGNAILDKEQVATSALTYGVGALQFNSSRYYANFGIDDILVRSVANDDIPDGFSTVAVTVNYVDAEGKTVKPSDTVEFAPGEVVTLTSAYTSDFKVDAEGAVWTAESESAPVTKYIYESDNSKEVVAEEGAEVNVVFRGVGSRRVAMRYQYQDAETGEMMTKNAAGANLPFFYDSNVAGDILFEGDVQRVYYPYYLLVDGYLYKTGANSGDADHYDYTVTAGTTTASLSPITWTPATEMVGEEGEQEEVYITNAIFAEETENIPGMTVVKDNYTIIRQANGAAGSAIGGDVLVTTLMPGKYTITTASRSGTTNFLVDGNVVCTVSTSGTVTTVTSEEFEVTKPTALYIQEQASTTQYSDYVLIRKTGDVEASYVYLSNYAVTCDGEYNEDGDVVAYVTYDVDIVGEFIWPDAWFAYEVKDADGNFMYGAEMNPQEGLESGTMYLKLSDLTPQTEYTITITGVKVTDYDSETFDPIIVFEEEGTLATLTFTTGSIPTGIANVEAAPAVKADGKYLENGQIVIYRGGVKYNAAGAVIR